MVAYDAQQGDVDLSNLDTLRQCMSGGANVVVCCLPGALGFRAAQVACEVGVPYVDLSFMPEDSWAQLTPQAPMLVDCGLSPGLSNLVVGKLAAEAGTPPVYAAVYVGGVAPTPDYGFHGYATTWSVDDLLEEYRRPARWVCNGEIVASDPMDPTEWRTHNFEGAGTMEAFRSDGLRTLLHNPPMEFLSEYTLRWPGHLNAIAPHVADGTLHQVLPQGMMDLVVLEVTVAGKPRARLIDRGDTWRTGMQRTTAYTCAACVEYLLLHGSAQDLGVGVFGMEALARTRLGWPMVVSYLAARGVHLQWLGQ